MCDFSAKAAKQRAAAKDDHLVTRSISDHTVGFTSVSDSSTAVCLLPGTELAFDAPVQFDKSIAGCPTRTGTMENTVARFRQIEKENKHTHHDALEFPGGKIIKLNDLIEGQTAKVVQLPASPKNEVEVEDQKRVEYV